jgi:hypothetical protein
LTKQKLIFIVLIHSRTSFYYWLWFGYLRCFMIMSDLISFENLSLSILVKFIIIINAICIRSILLILSFPYDLVSLILRFFRDLYLKNRSLISVSWACWAIMIYVILVPRTCTNYWAFFKNISWCLSIQEILIFFITRRGIIFRNLIWRIWVADLVIYTATPSLMLGYL